MKTYRGRARVFGDDVNTDYIISSRRKRDTVDPAKLAQFLMEDIRPGFGPTVRPGDILVAGKNFGCGSAMEIAPLVISASGIQVIIAESFARTFYRNAVNGGILPVQIDTHGISEGDEIQVCVTGNVVEVIHLNHGWTRVGDGVPDVLQPIVEAGGLINYLRTKGGF